MKRFRKYLCVNLILLIVLSAFTTGFTAFGATISTVENTISDIIEYEKKTVSSDSYIINDEFIKKAGTTDGDWYVLGLKQYGISDNYDDYLTALENKVKDNASLSTTDKQRICLTITACGGNPKNIDGKNLLSECTYECTALKSVTARNIYALFYGLIALDSKGYSVPNDAKVTREDIIDRILALELESGGFVLSGNTADIDTTACAITALAPYKEQSKVKKCIDNCIKLLSDKQSTEGTFSSYGSQNAESTAQVIVALTSLNINPDSDSRFTKGGNSVVDGLMAFRNSDGGFAHTKGSLSNSMATAQSLYGLVSYWRYYSDYENIYSVNESVNNSAVSSINESNHNTNKDSNNNSIKENSSTSKGNNSTVTSSNNSNKENSPTKNNSNVSNNSSKVHKNKATQKETTSKDIVSVNEKANATATTDEISSTNSNSGGGVDIRWIVCMVLFVIIIACGGAFYIKTKKSENSSDNNSTKENKFKLANPLKGIKKKTIVILGTVFVILIGCAIAVTIGTHKDTQIGDKNITICVVANGESESFDINTDREYLDDVLEDKNIASGYESSYGLFITTANGITADTDKNQWWCITMDGDTVNYGASSITIKDGDKYELTLKEGY